MIWTHFGDFFPSFLGRSDLQPYFWPSLRPRVHGRCQVIWSERPSFGNNADSCSVLTSVFVHTGTDLLWLLILIEVFFFSSHRIDLREEPRWGLCYHLRGLFQWVPAYSFCEHIWFHHTTDCVLSSLTSCVYRAELQKCMTETAVISHSSVLITS